ncbi:MAG TPA: hypothetical protein VMF31_10700 [Solirubrobacterales bacterium]|nr:hypothetical protein [Solirubrobacterales bacterium]
MADRDHPREITDLTVHSIGPVAILDELTGVSERCPFCDAELKGTGEDGEPFNHLVAIHDAESDRLVAWQCPACERTSDTAAGRRQKAVTTAEAEGLHEKEGDPVER